MSGWAIEAIELVKEFPRKAAENGDAAKQRRRLFSKKAAPLMFTALDGVSLEIGQGEIFGLLGSNGAGKLTTIRMMCTLLEPTSGTARVNGFDITRQANQMRASLGRCWG